MKILKIIGIGLSLCEISGATERNDEAFVYFSKPKTGFSWSSEEEWKEGVGGYWKVRIIKINVKK